MMTVKDLKDYLSNFTDDAEVQIWTWTKTGDRFYRAEVCCNYEHQKKNNTVQLRSGISETIVEDVLNNRINFDGE